MLVFVLSLLDVDFYLEIVIVLAKKKIQLLKGWPIGYFDPVASWNWNLNYMAKMPLLKLFITEQLATWQPGQSGLILIYNRKYGLMSSRSKISVFIRRSTILSYQIPRSGKALNYRHRTSYDTQKELRLQRRRRRRSWLFLLPSHIRCH